MKPPGDRGLDARREAWLQAVRDRTVSTIAPTLEPSAAAQAMSNAVKAIHSLTNENIAMIEANASQRRRAGISLPQIACSKGCDYCCSLRVKAAAPEVIAIADHIRANWNEEQKAGLLARIEAYQAQFENLTPTQQVNKAVTCPLLEDHACSIHSVRPIACRRHHSTDVEACKKGQIAPDKVQIPHYLEVDTTVAPIVTGLQNAMKAKGLRSPMMLLAPGLKIALTEPEAKQKWLSGKDVFASAVDRGIDQLSFAKFKKRPEFEV